MWSVFFDVFVTVAREHDVRHTESTATAFFRLFGWILMTVVPKLSCLIPSSKR